MVILKSKQQIAQLRKAGRIVAETYEVLRPPKSIKLLKNIFAVKGPFPATKAMERCPRNRDVPLFPPFLPLYAPPSTMSSVMVFQAPEIDCAMAISSASTLASTTTAGSEIHV